MSEPALRIETMPESEPVLKTESWSQSEPEWLIETVTAERAIMFDRNRGRERAMTTIETCRVSEPPMGKETHPWSESQLIKY